MTISCSFGTNDIVQGKWKMDNNVNGKPTECTGFVKSYVNI